MADATNIAGTSFDGAVAWDRLDPKLQAAIGAAALEAAVGRAISEHAGGAAARAGYEAERLALEALQEAALGVGGLHDGQWIDQSSGAEQFRLPAAIGLVCEGCGCSEGDACEGGCAWADNSDTLCTACAEARG